MMFVLRFCRNFRKGVAQAGQSIITIIQKSYPLYVVYKTWYSLHSTLQGYTLTDHTL